MRSQSQPTFTQQNLWIKKISSGQNVLRRKAFVTHGLASAGSRSYTQRASQSSHCLALLRGYQSVSMALQPGLRHRILQKMRVMAQVDGDSSDSEADQPTSQTARCACGQFVWPCPREYPADAIVREREKHFIPADFSKEKFGRLFKATLEKFGHAPNIVKIHVFDEPHKRYNRQTGMRERHKHAIFKMRMPFAHVRIQKDLATCGIYGHFSFNLIGYVAYLRYLMVPSAKKLLSDIDRAPWSYPPVPPKDLLALCATPSPQMEARSGGIVVGRKRKLLTFSEITDIFVEEHIRTERHAWSLAKRRKELGDDVLWNTLDDSKSVSSLVSKVRQAWSCENMSSGTLVTEPDYHLGNFIPLGMVDKRLLTWMKQTFAQLVLILCGKGGLGKTELACALMHAVAQSRSSHFINRVDRLRDLAICPGEGLVIDEANFSMRDIDDVKGILDIKKTRDVACRNRDGLIPAGTPRIISTNWSWSAFWPHEAGCEEHAGAIRRRVLWVDVSKDVRRLPRDHAMASADEVKHLLVIEEDEEEDPFGHGRGFD